MAKVILGATMCLDGFINDRSGSLAALYPDLDTWRDTEPGRFYLSKLHDCFLEEKWNFTRLIYV